MTEFVDILFQLFVAMSLTMPRVYVALQFVPIFSKNNLHGMAKHAVIFAVSLPIIIGNYIRISSDAFANIFFPLYVVKELILGFTIGFILGAPYWVFQSVGVMIDNQRGALSGGYFNPGAGPDSSMLADFLTKALAIVMIVTGSFAYMFALIVESYTLWPTLEWFPLMSPDAHTEFISQFSRIIYFFVLYAGPIILVLLLVEAGFAVLGAYSPQMQVYFMAMPAKSLIALIILIMYLSNLWHIGFQNLSGIDQMRQSLINIWGMPKR
ncbi:type III secretion system export apparatus subunit SctT [Agarilytica rhodophyticola]|uniref:type III secretion system export apparatus subunit SctT n=1 Tax=Agarilytica rhodophyticola TaxID=1737490 RepID=UPI000B3424AE|nr:type III secretion system export apparatus subunit SctT [Agarilytica rhodophyticola]